MTVDQQNHIQWHIHIAKFLPVPILEWWQSSRLVHGAAKRLKCHLDKSSDHPALRVPEKSGAMIYRQNDAPCLRLMGNSAGPYQRSAHYKPQINEWSQQ